LNPVPGIGLDVGFVISVGPVAEDCVLLFYGRQLRGPDAVAR
jgi:hypothetical protein